MASDLDEADALPELEVGTTISNAFSLMRSQPLIVFGLSFLVIAVPTRLIYYGTAGLTTPGLKAGALFFTGFAGMILQTIFAGVLVGTALTVAATGSGGRIGPPLDLPRLSRLFAAGFLYALGCTIGLVALFIPLFFLLTRWSVVAPVVGVEDCGIGTAFGRSSELTRGARLRILGLFFASGIIALVFTMPIHLLLLPLIGSSTAAQDFTVDPLGVAVKTLMETLTGGFSAAVTCALYIQLRERHDGPVADRLGEIFA